MLVRSITQHVKDQNWFAVALDFFIVVVGILIAFQITNWSDTRGDQVHERQIIERLHADFETLGREVDEKIEFMRPIIGLIEEIETLMTNDPNESDRQRLENFYESAFSLPSISSQSDTYEQLVSSGEMNLLTNDELRSELVTHASLTREFLHQDRAIREWSRPYMVPFVRLRSLMGAMPLEEAIAEAGSKADLIVAIDMYQGLFQSQLSVQEFHRESFTKLTKMLAEEQAQ